MKKPGKKRFKLLISVIALACLLTACGTTQTVQNNSGQVPANATASPVSELVVAGNEIAIGVDPTVYPGADYLLNMGAAEVLFKADPDGIIQPYLAKGAIQIDEYVWEIQLHPEACFWSGDPVTAEAVIASLARSRELDMKANPYVEGIEFTAIDEYTVKAVSKIPNLDIPMNLSNAQLVIHNTAEQYTYEGIDTADYTGMYKIVAFQPAQKMVFEKNENYWGQKPEIDRVVHEQIGDSDARVLAALSGRYHVVMDIPFTANAQFEASDAAHISAVPASNTQTIYLNTGKEALSDYRVRQALSWGLDREELVLMGEEGLSTPVTTWLGSNPAYAGLKNAFFDAYNPEKAAQLLDEAGWLPAGDGYRYKDGKQLAVFLRTFRTDKALGETVQIQWTKLGVKVSVQHGDYSLITTARETGEWDASIEAWGTFGNISAMLKGQYAPDGSANYGRFTDEKTNGLLKKIEEAPNAETRRERATELTMHIAEQSPAIYLCPRPQLTAVSNKLEGFIPHFRQFENVVNANLRIAE